MRTKIIAALLAVLTALGGLNLFKSIKDRLIPSESETVELTAVQEVSDSGTDGKTRVRVRVRANGAEVENARESTLARVAERLAIHVRDGAETMIDRRFDVREGQTLFIDVEHADVTVNTGATDEAHVVVSLSSTNLERAHDIFDEMNFRVNMVGDEVRIESDALDGNWNSDWNGGLDIKINATIPERFNARMKTTHGDVDLDDIEGVVDLNTTHGDVSAASIVGPEITLKSTHGDIAARSLQSDAITVNTTHADIDIASVNGRAFSATTSHSDIHIEKLLAPSEIQTSHGDIEVNMPKALSAKLTTSHGDVVVYAPASISADLDLAGAQVRVSGFDVQGDVQKDRVSGRVGSGGARIFAHTTHGSIDVKNQ
jgi:DUF4097 and DUF4098 domain-containing protein YvlB